MAYRKVGETVTDQNGRAVINYSGTGAGLIELIAETTIDGRTIQSEIYSILDCGFYDKATDNTKSSSWYNGNSALQVNYSSNGTTLTNVDATATNRHYFYNDPSISTVKLSGMYTILNNSAIEFEITDITSQIEVYLTDGTNNKSVPISTTGLYKIVIDGENIHLFKDGVEQTLTGSVVMNGTNIRVSFLLNTTNESVTFKDFKVYPF